MLRLEPGDKAFAIRILDAAEAHEGGHLVQVAPHRLFHLLQPMDQRIGEDRQQHAVFVEQPPQQLVQQRETLRIAMAQHGCVRGRHRRQAP